MRRRTILTTAVEMPMPKLKRGNKITKKTVRRRRYQVGEGSNEATCTNDSLGGSFVAVAVASVWRMFGWLLRPPRFCLSSLVASFILLSSCIFYWLLFQILHCSKFEFRQTSNLFRDEGRRNTAVVVSVRFQKICLIRRAEARPREKSESDID